MASKITIWNMALGFLGTRTLSSETDQCLEAIQCNLFWDHARRMTLQAYPFQFAQKKMLLAEKILPEEYKNIWHYAYSIPYNCLNAQAITDTNNFYEQKFFEIILSQNEEKMLLCDISPCYLYFTEDVTNTELFDDLFINALAYKLASLIAIPLLKNNSAKIQELTQLYEMAIPKAVQSNARQQKEKPYADEWLMARY